MKYLQWAVFFVWGFAMGIGAFLGTAIYFTNLAQQDAQNSAPPQAAAPLATLSEAPPTATTKPQTVIIGPQGESPTPVPTLAPADNAPSAMAQVGGPSYEAVCDADTNNMTDPQIAAFAEQWIGQRFSGWRGWVYDVVSRADGTYNLEIAMEERGLFWSRNIVIENIVSSLAMRLNVEQPIMFSGRVARNEVFLEGLCNPLVVEDYVLIENP